MSLQTQLTHKINEFFLLLAMARCRGKNITPVAEDYTFKETVFLEYLYRFPGQPQLSISRFLGLPLTTIVDITKRLEAEDLIVADSKKKQGRKFSLTDKGANLVLPEIRWKHACGAGVVFADKFSEEDATVILSLFEKLLSRKDILSHPRLATEDFITEATSKKTD